MAKRITLSNRDLTTEAGRELLALLRNVTADGEISLGDVQAMRAWLDARGQAEVAAIAWLQELVTLILADGRVTASERVDLLLAIERVLPADERLLAKKRREVAEQVAEPGRPLQGAHRASGRDRPATDAQVAYLQALGFTCTDGLTIASASAKLDELVGRRGDSPSNRQLMVLRFWDRIDVAKGGSSGASDWMSAHYAQDPDHREAWELWKQEHPECQSGQGDPHLVPIGAGVECLRRVRAAKAPSPLRPSRLLALLVVAAIAYLVCRIAMHI